jgi:hypothetical protein
MNNITETIKGYCPICGEHTFFDSNLPIGAKGKRNNFFCRSCKSSSRNRHIAKVILQCYNSDKNITSLINFAKKTSLTILNLCSYGAIHTALKEANHYYCSEYFDHTPSGQYVNGIQCQNLEQTTYLNNFFDIIISEDILEHINDPRKACIELSRILKNSGRHISTIAVSLEKPRSKQRAKLENGTISHLLPPVYHGDMIREEGALVFFDFGKDIITKFLSKTGKTEIIWPDKQSDFMPDNGILHNMVFVSQKPDEKHNDSKFTNLSVMTTNPIKVDNKGIIIMPHIPKAAGNTLYLYLKSVFNSPSAQKGLTIDNYNFYLEWLNKKKITGSNKNKFSDYLNEEFTGELIIDKSILLKIPPINACLINNKQTIKHYQSIKNANAEKRLVIFGHFRIIKYYKYLPDASYMLWLRNPYQRLISSYYYRIRACNNDYYRGTFVNKINIEEHIRKNSNYISKFIEPLKIEESAFIGFTEEFDKSLALFNKILKIEEGFTQTNAKNTNPNKKVIEPYYISQKTKDLITKYNQKDIELYEKAKIHFQSLCDIHLIK